MNRKRLTFQVWFAILLAATAIFALSVPGFADDVDEAYRIIGTIFDYLKIVYNFFLEISLPLMAVALAVMGLEAILGGERSVERAVQGAKWMLMGYAVLVFLPSVLSVLSQVFKTSGMLYQPSTTPP